MSKDISVLEFIVELYKIIKRNLIILLSITIIGVLIGFFNTQRKDKVFISKMVVYSNIIDSDNLVLISRALAPLAESANKAPLQESLNIDEGLAAGIRSVRSKKVEIISPKEYTHVLAGKIEGVIELTVGVTDLTRLDELSDAFIQYLDNHNLVKRTADRKKERLTTVIEKIDLELAELDKAQNLITEIASNESNFENLSGFVYNAGHKEQIDLLKEKAAFQEELDNISSIAIISPLRFQNETAGSPAITLSMYLFVSLLLALLVVVVRELNRLT